MASGPAAAPTKAVVSATVKVVCNVLIEPTAPTRRMSLNRVGRSRANRIRTRLRPDPRCQASTAAVSAVVKTTAIPAPAIPSAGIGPKPKIKHGRERHQQDHPDTDRQRGHEHVAGPADDTGQGIHQPDQPNTGEHHVRIEERRLERFPLAAERAVERSAEGQDEDGETKAEQQVDDDGMQHQRVGVGAASTTERAGDGRGDAASHSAGGEHLHHHEHGKDQRHAGQRVSAEMRDPPGLDESGRGLRQHDQNVRPGQAQQGRNDRPLQQQARARIEYGRLSDGGRRAGKGDAHDVLLPPPIL